MSKSASQKTERKLSRTAATGKFEAPTPLTDPGLLRYCMGTISAVDTLMPTLLALMHASESAENKGAFLEALRVLVLVRETFEQHLHVDSTSGELDMSSVHRIVERAEMAWRKVFEDARFKGIK